MRRRDPGCLVVGAGVDQSRRCPICRGTPTPAGVRYSAFSQREFHYGLCNGCGIGIVLDPRTDFDELYSEDYYRGKGADPLVNYLLEDDNDPARTLEFSGLEAAGRSLVRPGSSMRWLDFGAGMGTFVQYLRRHGWNAYGVDDGFAQEQLVAKGLALDSDITGFDVVSAIEVIEHLIDPLAAVVHMASFLSPGGRLLITTGNLDKVRRLDRWKYAAVPEVHVTFWTPKAWRTALAHAGLEAEDPPGFAPSVTQYKVVKNLPALQRPLVRYARLWRGPAKMIDKLYGVSAFPVGRRPR